MSTPQHIVSLKINNFMRVRVAHIEPDGSMVKLRGANGEGKTSILRAIVSVLGGKKHIPPRPVHGDAEESIIVLETQTLTVRLRMTATSENLIVKAKDGSKLGMTSQALLNNLVGALSFDPLAWIREKSKDQSETLRQLVGLDLTAVDKRHDSTYASRTIINRDLVKAKALLSEYTHHKGAPSAEVSVTELADELERRRTVNQKNEDRRDGLDALRTDAKGILSKIARLKRELEQEEANLADHNKRGKELAAEVETLVDEDTEEVRTQMLSAEATNEQVRENLDHARAAADVLEQSTASKGLTAELKDIASERAAMISEVEYPIDGLAVVGDTVEIDGVPLEQASKAHQIRIATAIGLALNPELRIILIHDGALLNTESLRMLAEQAAEAGAQVWVEIADDGEAEGAGLLIEGGLIVPESEKQRRIAAKS